MFLYSFLFAGLPLYPLSYGAAFELAGADGQAGHGGLPAAVRAGDDKRRHRGELGALYYYILINLTIYLFIIIIIIMSLVVIVLLLALL